MLRQEEHVVLLALSWLAKHQDVDGRFDVDGFTKHDRRRGLAGKAGYGNPLHDVAVTALAVLAFLAHGDTLRSGRHRQVIKRGVDWLRKQQQENGRFGAGVTQAAMYDHVLATYAMVEAAGLSNSIIARRVARRGLAFLETRRHADGGWGYTPYDAASNLALTGWCILTLKSAIDFELEVPADAMERALGRVRAMARPENDGRFGYRGRWTHPYRHSSGHEGAFPPWRTESLAAIALYAQLWGGNVEHPTAAMTRTANVVKACPPRPKPRNQVDHHYWLFGSLAMYWLGPGYFDDWNEALTHAVVDTQRRFGPFKGSWDPIGVWGGDGGRIYSTAVMAIVLSVHYRYCRLVR